MYNKQMERGTNLKLPHQKCDEGSIDAAFGDENTVGEFGSLCDLQIFLCRDFQHSDELMEEEINAVLFLHFKYAAT